MISLLLEAPTLTLIAVPAAESPAQHLRNSLMLLSLLKEQSPAFWMLNPGFEQAERRAQAAVTLLELNGPSLCAAHHVRRAIEALLTVDADWEVVELIPAAMARLFAAWFPLTASAEEN